jgi:hypothetical protein
MIVISLISAFLITAIIEFIVAYLMGYRGKDFYIILALVNVITNPLLNYVLLILYFFNLLYYDFAVIIILEILVVLSEWRILSWAMPKQDKSFLLLSIVINVSSYLVGVLLQF